MRLAPLAPTLLAATILAGCAAPATMPVTPAAAGGVSAAARHDVGSVSDTVRSYLQSEFGTRSHTIIVSEKRVGPKFAYIAIGTRAEDPGMTWYHSGTYSVTTRQVEAAVNFGRSNRSNEADPFKEIKQASQSIRAHLEQQLGQQVTSMAVSSQRIGGPKYAFIAMSRNLRGPGPVHHFAGTYAITSKKVDVPISFTTNAN